MASSRAAQTARDLAPVQSATLLACDGLHAPSCGYIAGASEAVDSGYEVPRHLRGSGDARLSILPKENPPTLFTARDLAAALYAMGRLRGQLHVATGADFVPERDYRRIAFALE